jgi:hypothetical protein
MGLNELEDRRRRHDRNEDAHPATYLDKEGTQNGIHAKVSSWQRISPDP